MEKHEFRYGKEYVTNGKGSPTYKEGSRQSRNYYFFMTTTCFAKASMIYQGAKAPQIREYFSLVNRALLDRVGESIWSRLKIDSPEEIISQIQSAKYIKKGQRPGNYHYKFGRPAGEKTFYLGITGDMNTRHKNHTLDKGPLEDWEDAYDPFPQAKEALYERYLAPFRRGIPEDARGYLDGFVPSPAIPKLMKIVDKEVKHLDIAILRAYETIEVPSPISPTRENCLVKENSPPRKNAHDWRDGLIVRYDQNGLNPIVIQDAPKVLEFAQHESEEVLREHPEGKEIAHIEDEITSLSSKQKDLLIARLLSSQKEKNA